MIDKVKIKGTIKFYELIRDETGKIIEEKLLGIWHNLLPETGRELLADIMVDNISYYSPSNIYPSHIAVGSDDKPVTIDDWKLESEEHRDPITAKERISGTSIAQFTAEITGAEGYTIYEVGLFLSGTAPTEDPQIEESERVNAMVTRAVESDGIPKGEEAELKIIYQIQF